MTIEFTQGDTLRPLSGTLRDDASGQAVDLTAATELSVHVRRPDRTVISRSAEKTDAAAGKWSMGWQPGDLSLAGIYTAEVQVTWPGGVQTFGPVSFLVQQQIA